MKNKSSLFIGIILILIGILSLLGNLLLPKGQSTLSGMQLWPLFIVTCGLIFCLPPFFFQHLRGLAGLLIPGFLILSAGVIIYICAITGNWQIWSFVWPLEIVAIGLAFLSMAFWMHQIWLAIPASVFFFNGLLLLFYTTTSSWSPWKILWVLEPFFIGLPLLIIGFKQKIQHLAMTGAGLVVLSILGLANLPILISNIWFIGSIFFVGLVFVYLGLGKINSERIFSLFRK